MPSNSQILARLGQAGHGEAGQSEAKHTAGEQSPVGVWSGMAGLGTAWQGMAGLNTLHRFGGAEVRQCGVRRGEAWRCRVWRGTASHTLLQKWSREERQGASRLSLARQGMAGLGRATHTASHGVQQRG
jgi:hypothetical protein